ncbi:transcriptional regulator [Rhizobium sp. Root274]|uniref:GAF domain-containing protein n=1 Tax=unclassified Rhizobium TaxID=2613769 RepID=UPI000715B579|nr:MULTISPECIES: GAF domain-containing protein [unclassified Rhizobium]KQW31244.1 transcriptional regulator [Rhizobium sp. Root1240]KRD32789.1 transcriptional regulator [Rhizobium sp. Root274]
MIALTSLRDSFEGVIPSVIATTDAEGTPNISYLSHVHIVGDRHVALSNQFFSKTTTNVAANGLATVMVVDGMTGAQHILDLEFERSETEGPLFDRLAAHLAILEHGMAGIMRLKAADIYRVKDCREVPTPYPLEAAPIIERPDLIEPTARLSRILAAASDTESLLDSTLDGLARMFSIRHAMVLVPDDSGRRMITIASSGYDSFGFGAEVDFGDGVIGIAAATRQIVRITDLSRGRRYVDAVRSMAGLEGVASIPLPALDRPFSQIALPMVVHGRLVGLLFAESEERFAFRHRDEQALDLIATQLAQALLLAEQERERPEQRETRPATVPVGRPVATHFQLRFYPRDGSLFLDDDYLIRGVPGRLLKHLVEEYLKTGKREFLNREIRREGSLMLPDIKDNLETRLILLRRRLSEKGGPIRLSSTERGRLRLEVEGQADLVIVEA